MPVCVRIILVPVCMNVCMCAFVYIWWINIFSFSLLRFHLVYNKNGFVAADAAAADCQSNIIFFWKLISNIYKRERCKAEEGGEMSKKLRQWQPIAIIYCAYMWLRTWNKMHVAKIADELRNKYVQCIIFCDNGRPQLWHQYLIRYFSTDKMAKISKKKMGKNRAYICLILWASIIE